MMDIYGDLDNYNEENNIEALQSENQQLKSKLQEYEETLQKLQMDFDKLEAKHKTLLENYSALLKTARAEIERKSQTITQINAEKDQMILRLVNSGGLVNTRGVHELRKSNYFNKRKSIDTVDMARDSQRDSPIAVPKPHKNEKKSLEPTKVPSESIIHNLREKDTQSTTAPMRISSTTKSMPAFRCEEPKFSADEDEKEDQPPKNITDNETPKSSAPSSIEERLLHPRDRERPRSSNESREKLRDTFEERKDIKFSGRSRSRERELMLFKERAFKHSYSGNRLKSPPRDRYNRTKSRDRRSDYRARDREEHERRYERRFGEERRIGDERHGGEDEERRRSDGRRIDEERRIEDEKRKADQRLSEKERRSGDEKRLSDERRFNEQKRTDDERRKSEQRRIDKEKLQSEQRRIDEEKPTGEKRPIDEERRSHEEKRKVDDRGLNEERRKSEQRRTDEERHKSEQRRIKEETRSDEKRGIADEKRLNDMRRIDEERRVGEQRRIDEERRKDQEMAEERRKNEQRRIEEERRSNEERRKHDDRMGVERQSRELRQKRRVEEMHQCEERRLSQERRHSIEQQKKPTLHDEDRELNAKRRKIENVTENFSRWGHSYDSPTLPFKAYNLPTSCQSPDEHVVERSPISDDIREIKLTAQSELDDPRFQCNRYVQVTDNRNKTVLASKAGMHVDLKVLNWNQATKPEKHVEMPNDLIEPPKDIMLPDLSEQQVKDIYTNIDESNHDVSMETSEINGDVPEDLLFCSALAKTATKLNDIMETKSKPTYDSSSEHKLLKYKIPKKKAIDQDVAKSIERPLDLLYKHYKALEPIAAEQKPHDVSKTKKAALREMVEVDLALSDDDLSYGKITATDSVENNITREKEETKEKIQQKDKSKTRSNKTKDKTMSNIVQNNTQNKVEAHIEKRDIKAKFSDLFGDSSLITPEDLNLPSEPAEAQNCLLALNENANLVGENESWSITTAPDDMVISKTNSNENHRHTSSSKNKQTKTSPKTDSSPETRVKSKDCIENHANDNETVKHDIITLLPHATLADDDGVIKTVIISSGVQPQNVAEPIIISPEINQAVVNNAEAVLKQNHPVLETVHLPEVHTALATSTPLREYSTKNEFVSNDSNSNQNLSSSQSRSASGTPDLKIIVKRKRRF